MSNAMNYVETDEVGRSLTTPAKSPEPESSRKSSEQALNRACEACRVSKVRCLVNPEAGSTQCQRCARAGRTCVFAAPAKRRQRKRTDVRVTELEKELKQIRDNLLLKTKASSNDMSDQSADEGSDDQAHEDTQKNTLDPALRANKTAKIPIGRPHVIPAASECKPKDLRGPAENDIVERGILSEQLAEEFLGIWRDDLAIASPGITIPKYWTAADLRVNKPALFHAVMAAASHSKGCDVSDKLHEEVVYLYARSIFINGNKSVENIQAMLTTVAFYSPPGQMQIDQWVNMAASMALSLGLASKPRTHEQLPKRAIRSLQKISSPEELLEHCRTVLTLYVISAGFSMRFKRPNILLFNSWMAECVIMLEKSRLLDDRRTIAWLKLQRIADEANTAFGFDDASTSFSLSELRMQTILRIFDRRMRDWRKSVSEEVMTLFLNIEAYQNVLSMWEFGMDGGRYDVTEFRNRHLTLPALDDDCVQPESLLSRSALQINATTMCIGAAHSIIDCFLEVLIDYVQKAPNILFVRVIFSLVALMKVDYAVGTDTELGELLDSNSLKVDYYLEAVLNRITEAIGPQQCRIPSHWKFLIEGKLKTWRDEYLQWRSEGRHTKRRKTGNTNTTSADTSQPPAFIAPSSQVSAPYQSSEQANTHLPNFATINNPYSTWTPTLDTATSTGQPMGDPATFTPDVGDFSAAFQNGDLYLWNDMTTDSFGGYIPQSGMYSGMGYESFNGQNF